MTAHAVQPAAPAANRDGLRPLENLDFAQDAWLTGLDAAQATKKARDKARFELPSLTAKLRPLSSLENTPGVRITGELHPLELAGYGSGSRRGRATQAEMKPLDAADSQPGVRPALDEHARLEKQTQRLVAQAFIGPVLKQMHNSPFKSSLWDGGRGGQAFSELYDQHLVDRVAKVSSKKLVASIVRKFEARKAYPAKRGGSPADTSNLNKSMLSARSR